MSRHNIKMNPENIIFSKYNDRSYCITDMHLDNK